MKNILPGKKLYSLVSLIIISSLLTACGSRTNFNEMTLLTDNVSSFSTVRGDAKDLLAKANEAYGEVKDFTGIVTILDSKNGNPEDNDIGESRFFFKKNRNERVEITKSSDSKKVGSILIYLGGDKVQILLAKAIPLLGKKFTLSVNDKKIATSRGVAFDQLDLTAMLGRLNKPGVKTAFLGEGSVNGRKTFAVEGIGTFKDIDSGVTREVVQIDAETMLPIQDEAFVGAKTVLKISISDLKLNVGLKDDTFVLPDGKLATATRK